MPEPWLRTPVAYKPNCLGVCRHSTTTGLCLHRHTPRLPHAYTLPTYAYLRPPHAYLGIGGILSLHTYTPIPPWYMPTVRVIGIRYAHSFLMISPIIPIIPATYSPYKNLTILPCSTPTSETFSHCRCVYIGRRKCSWRIIFLQKGRRYINHYEKYYTFITRGTVIVSCTSQLSEVIWYLKSYFGIYVRSTSVRPWQDITPVVPWLVTFNNRGHTLDLYYLSTYHKYVQMCTL